MTTVVTRDGQQPTAETSAQQTPAPTASVTGGTPPASSEWGPVGNGEPTGEMTTPGGRPTGGPSGRRRLARTAAGAGVVLLLAAAAVLVTQVPAVRLAAAVLGCLVLPGLGWARRLRLRDTGDTVALTLVLSICATTVVATAMAVLARWSTPVGALVLLAVSLLGFVPARRVARAVAVFLLGRPLAPAAAELPAAEEEWVDWYADARRRSDAEREQQAAAARTAEEEWRRWYAAAHGDDGGTPPRWD